MRNTRNATFKRTALAAAILSACGPALADGPENTVSIGGGAWTNNRPVRGEYDGMRDGKGYLLLDADILKRDDETGIWLGLKVRNLGTSAREVKGEVDRQGDMGGSFEYNQIPYDNPYRFNTGLQGIGSTRQLVPTPSIVPGTGRNVELGTERDRYTSKFYKTLGEGFTLRASYIKEDKDGTRQWGRGGAPEFAVEPINSTTRQYEAAIDYARGPLSLSAGYYGTSYNNSNGLVVTSLSSLAAASFYNLTLPLDNQSHQFYLNGGYDFTATTRGTLKASYTRATQNEFLPTDRPGLIYPAGQAPSPLAPRKLDGKLDTTLVEAGLTSKPIKDLSLNANLRYRNFNDKTPVDGYVFAGSTPTVFNTPFSYKTWTGKLDAIYRLQGGYSLLGGAEYSNQDRWVPDKGTLYVPFRSSLDETTLRAGVRKSLSETVNGSLTYVHANRDGGHYKNPNSVGEPNENTINPLNIADRKRNKLRGVADWAPMENLSLQFIAEGSKDNYSGQQYGLDKGTAQTYTLDGSYQLGQNWSVNAWFTLDYTKADENTLNGTVGKDNTLKENGKSYGVGLRGTVMDKLKLGADVERFRSENKYHQDLTGGVLASNMVPTPDITNKLFRMKAFAQYPLAKNADLRFNMIREKYFTNDWSWSMFPPTGETAFAYGTTTDGTTVISNQHQNSTFAGLRYILRFE